MQRFDDWVTDPRVTRAGVDAFIADREQIGERFLGRYVLWKSSGTTGEPGIFVQDADALAVCDALITAQSDAAGLTQRFAQGMITHGGRAAVIAATGEHFATVASWRRVRVGNPWLPSRCLSVLEPLPRLVAELNAYRPAFVASYPTMLFLLAAEKAAGRLTIRQPACVGRRIPCARDAGGDRARVRLPDRQRIGASECMSIAFGCRAGWLHVNADWVMLEAVDRDYRPVPPGEPSHSVLLTNLANRVQPVIRYDLGDSIVVSQRCACGNPLPAIQVEGRRGDIIALAAPDGTIVRLFAGAVDRCRGTAGVHGFRSFRRRRPAAAPARCYRYRRSEGGRAGRRGRAARISPATALPNMASRSTRIRDPRAAQRELGR